MEEGKRKGGNVARTSQYLRKGADDHILALFAALLCEGLRFRDARVKNTAHAVMTSSIAELVL